MRRLGLLSLAAALALLGACMTPEQRLEAKLGHPPGVSRALLASEGEVHDAVVVLFAQDPRVKIVDAKHAVQASWRQNDQEIVLTAYFAPGFSEDQSTVEVVCTGPASAQVRRRLEEEWIGKIPASLKYYGLQIPPQMRTPLDEGPRAELPDEAPTVDQIWRY